MIHDSTPDTHETAFETVVMKLKKRTLHIECEGAKETMRHSSVLTVQTYGKKNEIKKLYT